MIFLKLMRSYVILSPPFDGRSLPCLPVDRYGRQARISLNLIMKFFSLDFARNQNDINLAPVRMEYNYMTKDNEQGTEKLSHADCPMSYILNLIDTPRPC